MSTPRTNYYLNDGTLPRESQSQDLNRRIILIGTSERGPMYTATSIKTVTQARSVFGLSTVGTLVKAFEEAVDAQRGSEKSPDVVLIRIGDELASKANLELAEASDATTNSLILYAAEVGGKYNEVLVQFDGSEFKVYNPVSALWSIFNVDFSGADQASYNDVEELANAINLDTNLTGVVIAEVNDQEARFELDVATADYVANVGIDLTSGGSVAEVASNLVYDNSTVDAAKSLDDIQSGTGLKKIKSIDMVYALTASDFVVIPKSVKSYEIPTGVVHSTTNAGYNSLLNVIDVKSVDTVDLADWAKSPNAGGTPAVASQAFEMIDGEALTITDVTNTADDSSTEITATIISPFGIGVIGDGFLKAADTDSYAYHYETAMGYTPDELVATELLPAAANIGLTSAFGIAQNFQVKVTYGGTDYYLNSADAGAILFSVWDNTTKVATLTLDMSLAEDVNGSANALAIADAAAEALVLANAVAIGTGVSAAGLLNEIAAGVSLGTSNTNYRFIDNKIIFGGVTQRRRIVRHLARIDYSSNEVSFNQTDGTLLLNGPQPGFGANGTITGNIVIGLKLGFVPEEFSSGVNTTLRGGSAGLGVVEQPLYFKREVAAALNEVEATDFAIVHVPKFYLDTTMTTYNEDTGERIVTNAGYANTMSAFLNGTYGGHALGIMDFSPMVGTGPNASITRADVKARYEQLAVVNSLDALRVANTVNALSDLHLVAVDLEGEFVSDGVAYYNQASAAIAGLLSTMPSDEAVYTRYIPNVRKLRFQYTERTAAGASQIDSLSDSRINVGIAEAGGVRLSDGLTLAGSTSDYELISTFWMVEKMLSRTDAIGRAYLGLAPNILRIEALRDALETSINEMVPNEITKYKMVINVDPIAKAMKKIDIQYQTVPAGETRAFNVTQTLRATEADIV